VSTDDVVPSAAGPGDDPGRSAGPAADGRRRRRWAIAVVAVAVASAVGGAIVGSRLQSPADAANDRRPPRASRITVGVESRTLSATLTLAGDISFAEPTPIALAGSVGIAEGETAVVTRPPVLDAAVAEGDVLLEVSGRPVIVLTGELPMYRSIGPGASGSDVAQLEAALARLGFDPGPLDETFDAATEAAVDALYASKGAPSAGASPADLERLQGLRDRVSIADRASREAREALSSAGQGTTGSDLLQLQQDASRARDAVPAAAAQAERNDADAQGDIAARQAGRDAARVARDGAAQGFALAVAPGAIDPETGEPYTPAAVTMLRDQLQAAESLLVAAGNGVDAAVRAAAQTAAAGDAATEEARDARELAELRLREASEPADISTAQEAFDASQVELWTAAVELQEAEDEIGTHVPAGEVVFVPALPLTVTDVAVTPGAAVTGELATVSSGVTEVGGRVSTADAELVAEGAPVVIEIRETDEQFAGTVSYVGPPRPAPSADPGDEGEGDGFPPPSEDEDEGSSRLQVLVTPADPDAVSQYLGFSVRIRIDVGSTNGDVLVVPVAAVSVGGDGSSQVEVEVEPVTATSDGRTELVEVEVGLTAQGYVEVRPVSGALAGGDRVVVGIDDRGTADDTDTDDADERDDGGQPADTDEPADDELAPLGTDDGG
jgi:peptidoglycan hydrolase-like protein with peptidoglycan-binding domain